MAKTESIEVPDELKNVQRAALEQSDRFLLSVVQAHKSLPSDARKKLIKAQSLFGYLATFWRALTDEQKTVWREAAVYSGITNWQLFISDNAARIRNDLTLDVPPSDLWQVRAGQIIIESPATELILKQEHPQTYYVSQKVVGAPWKSEVIKLEEVFGFPLNLEIRYKSNLTAVGGGGSYTPPAGDAVNFSLSSFSQTSPVNFSLLGGAGGTARYYARVWSSYQGVDRYTDCEVTIDPSSDWTLGTASISSVIGHVIGYTLYIEIVGYTGELLFDNIRAVHGGTNWALDPRCDAIDKTFSKGFAAVPPFWIPVSLPTGAEFSSQYPPAL